MVKGGSWKDYFELISSSKCTIYCVDQYSITQEPLQLVFFSEKAVDRGSSCG
jgi:hypothetical protein